MGITTHEVIYYNTLEELNATYKPGNSDVSKLKEKYGKDVKFSHAVYPNGHEPTCFALECYEINDVYTPLPENWKETIGRERDSAPKQSTWGFMKNKNESAK